LHALKFARVRGRAERRVTAVDDVSFTVASGTAAALAELPRQPSGAQCQPVVTAGALARDAGLIIVREPVLMLDVSLRAGVLRLLARLHEDRRLAGSPAIRPRTALQTRGRCAT
jgi:ABC-type oligopeptide transport system ATPase subunit